MPTGAKKISQLPALTRNDSEIIPVVQDDGLGNLTTGTLPIADLGTDTNIYNTDGTLTASVERVVNMNGKIVRFDNGQFVVGDALGSSYLMEVNGTGESKRGLIAESSGLVAILGVDNSNVAVQGISSGSVGVKAETATGTALFAESSSTGKAGLFEGQTLVEEYGGDESISASALFEVKSTVKGALLPRMTTTERNTIGSPATGLEIFNTTTVRKEVYNGSYWQGTETRFLNIQHGQYNPTDAQTIAFGNSINAPTVSTNAYYNITMRGNGVIRGCDFGVLVGGTVGTNENWSLYVRHNGTDYLVQTVGSTAVVRNFTNTSLNIPYVDGDIVRMIFINPTWATNPTAVTGSGFLILQ